MKSWLIFKAKTVTLLAYLCLYQTGVKTPLLLATYITNSLLFDWITFNQTRKSVANSYVTILLNASQSKDVCGIH